MLHVTCTRNLLDSKPADACVEHLLLSPERQGCSQTWGSIMRAPVLYVSSNVCKRLSGIGYMFASNTECTIQATDGRCIKATCCLMLELHIWKCLQTLLQVVFSRRKFCVRNALCYTLES